MSVVPATIHVFWVQSDAPGDPGQWMLKFPFDPVVLESLKGTFTPGCRWDANLRVWYLDSRFTFRKVAAWGTCLNANMIWDMSCQKRKDLDEEDRERVAAEQEARRVAEAARKFREAEQAAAEEIKRKVWEAFKSKYGVPPGFNPHTVGARGHNSTTSPYHDMLASLPDDVLKKVYRTIATECHPDRGGAEKLMRDVNVAWDKIQKLRGS